MARFGHTVISGIIWIAILVAVAIFGGRVSGALGDVFLYGGFAVAALFTWHLIRTIRLQVEGMSLMKRDPERFDRMRASYERASGATEKARSPVAPANQGGGSNQVWSLASAMEYADSEATRL